MKNMHTDSEILSLLKDRQEEGLKLMEAAYGPYIRKTAFGILRSEEDAREVENDVYLRLWNQTEKETVTDLKAWTGTVSRRLAIDNLRARSALRREGAGYGEALEELAEVLPDSGASDPADALALQNALDGFLRSLPLKQRQLFLCRYWYGMSLKECREAFGMKESAVKTSLMRSREKLKDHLRQEEIQI